MSLKTIDFTISEDSLSSSYSLQDFTQSIMSLETGMDRNSSSHKPKQNQNKKESYHNIMFKQTQQYHQYKQNQMKKYMQIQLQQQQESIRAENEQIWAEKEYIRVQKEYIMERKEIFNEQIQQFKKLQKEINNLKQLFRPIHTRNKYNYNNIMKYSDKYTQYQLKQYYQQNNNIQPIQQPLMQHTIKQKDEIKSPNNFPNKRNKYFQPNSTSPTKKFLQNYQYKQKSQSPKKQIKKMPFNIKQPRQIFNQKSLKVNQNQKYNKSVKNIESPIPLPNESIQSINSYQQEDEEQKYDFQQVNYQSQYKPIFYNQQLDQLQESNQYQNQRQKNTSQHNNQSLQKQRSLFKIQQLEMSYKYNNNLYKAKMKQFSCTPSNKNKRKLNSIHKLKNNFFYDQQNYNLNQREQKNYQRIQCKLPQFQEQFYEKQEDAERQNFRNMKTRTRQINFSDHFTNKNILL